jgi:hypothetical protein
MNTHIFILHLVDTHPDLIADDLKISNIHNPTQPNLGVTMMQGVSQKPGSITFSYSDETRVGLTNS